MKSLSLLFIEVILPEARDVNIDVHRTIAGRDIIDLRFHIRRLG